jgi:hypothetical protein
MNGSKFGSVGNATTSGGEKVPVDVVVCCAQVGPLLHAGNK